MYVDDWHWNSDGELDTDAAAVAVFAVVAVVVKGGKKRSGCGKCHSIPPHALDPRRPCHCQAVQLDLPARGCQRSAPNLPDSAIRKRTEDLEELDLECPASVGTVGRGMVYDW